MDPVLLIATLFLTSGCIALGVARFWVLRGRRELGVWNPSYVTAAIHGWLGLLHLLISLGCVLVYLLRDR